MNREQLAQILGFAPSDEQWAAISAPMAGPLLVLAGAGSGKTTVMAARVVWLVGSGLVAADEVLGLTFTNKAAGELGARIRLLLGALRQPGDVGDAAPTIQTFHAFAMDLLSQWGLLIGAEPSSALLSPTDLAARTYRTVAASDVGCEVLGTGVVKTVSDRVGMLDEELSEHLVTPQQLRAHDQRLIEALSSQASAAAGHARQAAQRRVVASQVVQEVRSDRADDAVVSFADLMRHAVAASSVPHVRDSLRERFRVVLVDEYQDTSVAQKLMLQNLFAQGHPLTAVGDPLQAIYGWRGASVANIDGFGHDFSTAAGPAALTTLSINRRSGSLILDVANAVAAPVRLQHPDVKILQSGSEATGEVVAALHDTWQDEIGWLIDRVRGQLDDGTRADEIAVLCRTNDYVHKVAQALREAGIPVAAASLGSVLHVPEVVEVLSVLRVLEMADNPALVRLLTGPRWRIGPNDLAVLGRRAGQLAPGIAEADEDLSTRMRSAVADVDPVDVVSLLEAVYDPGPDVSDEARTRLQEFTRSLDVMRPALVSGVEEAAHRIVEMSGLGVEVRLGASAATRIDGLSALFDVIATYRRAHDDPSVAAFLRWLDFAVSLDETPDSDFPARGEAVRVMTVHRAKGLEWDCVFVPALSERVFPSAQGRSVWTRHYGVLPNTLRGDRERLPVLTGWTRDGGSFPAGFAKSEDALKDQCRQSDAWEENRLAYVALTRARKVLFASGHHWDAEGRRRGPSEYLLTISDVPEVLCEPWSAHASELPSVRPDGDVDWPPPDEVYARVEPPTDSGGSLTLAESDLLDRLDRDIAAVCEREYQQSLPVTAVDLPAVLSASLLMRAAADPTALARDLARPMPRITGEAAARGTAFHEWVAAAHEQLALIPDWDAALDADRVAGDELAELIAGYRTTPYAAMAPVAVETGISVRIGAMVVRGVIDAVFRHPDGTWEIVDWKTNRAQTADPLQLSLYRLGWAQQNAVAPEAIRAAFVYVRDGEVVRPPLLSTAEVLELLSQRENDAVTAQ